MKTIKRHRGKTFSLFAVILMIVSLFGPTLSVQSAGMSDLNGQSQSAAKSNEQAETKISNHLMKEFKDDDKVTFLVKFKNKADTAKIAQEAREAAETAKLSAHQTELKQRSAVISELKSVSFQSHQQVINFLEENDHGNAFHSYHIVNGMAVTATKEIAEKIASFPEVDKLLPNETRTLNTTFDNSVNTPEADSDDIEWSVDRVNAPDAWSMGINGKGTVVASLDTGVQWDHPALKNQYRGYDAASDEVDHDYSFYDATKDGNTQPVDDNGHGTHVTGTMVGHEEDGSNQIGVAPGAKWIAAKVFDSAGNATDVGLLDAAEWILAPGGRVDMAPDVVNNSWGGGRGLDEWYRDAVQAWRDANIFPEFAAGNTDLFNPGGPGSVVAPGNYPEAFTVGATDNDDVLADFSLRGPSPYNEIKPDISAPGVGIRSAIPGDGYDIMSGTSMASPAVSGIAALLRQVNANIQVSDMEEILTRTATEKTDNEYEESPNNGYGHGLIDAATAVSFIADGLGSIEGTVSEQGEDMEEPTFNHKPIEEVYVDMNTTFKINAMDNISILSVEFAYQINDKEWKHIDASLVSGDHADGDYEAIIPGDELQHEGDLSYKWIINDYGDNEVITDEYHAVIDEGITTGYAENFEEEPVGWSSFGIGNDWEWGIPTSGPGEAASGDHVYATNLDGSYQHGADATLVMPAVNLSEGDNYLHFDLWYDFEEIHDTGYVYVSTDQEEWKSVRTFFYDSDGWQQLEADLSDYSGERVYIGFNIKSNTPNDITKPGMYLDNVALSSEPNPNSLSEMTDKEIDSLNNKMVPEQITQSEPEQNAITDEVIQPAALPLGAQVSILGTSRATATDPSDGSYALTSLAAGDYTIQAEAYGYEPAEQSVTVESDQMTTANFTLEEIPRGTVEGIVTDQSTGEIIENAQLLLVEDANISPVTTDDEGRYQIDAYAGDYTLKVIARGYHYEEKDITIDNGQSEMNLELKPYYSHKYEEIGYDDGNGDFGRSFYDKGNRGAVKMSLAEGEETAIITDGVFQFEDDHYPRPGPGSTEFAIEVWDATGKDGLPGERIAGPIEAEAIRDIDEWTVIDLRDENIIVDGDFYMVYVQTNVDQYSPALASDATGPYAGRSYENTNGFWDKSIEMEGNYMIRARVGYEAELPEITIPEENMITSEKEIVIKGTATPNTSAKLLNNEEKVNTAEVDDSGEFQFDTELTEGDNTFTVVTELDDDITIDSPQVTVTLDTIAPEVGIDSPTDGDKTNRETVTVEGFASDDHLDYVEVNGAEANVDGDGRFTKRILLDNGENDIEVLAVDKAGNKTKKSVTLDAKYNAPDIENLTPAENQYINTGESVKIEFDSDPNAQASFVIHMPLTNSSPSLQQSTEFPLLETEAGYYTGFWTATSNAIADGAVIEVIIEDAYGNITRQQADGRLFINQE